MFTKSFIIPSAKECSIRRVTGVLNFELENSKLIRKEIDTLRKMAADAIREMIRDGETSTEIALVVWATDLPFGERFGTDAISVVDTELRALGYEVLGEAGGLSLTVSLPTPKNSAPTSESLRLVR